MADPNNSGEPATQKPVKPAKLSRKEKKRLALQKRLELKQLLIREKLLREIELVKKSLKRGKPLWEGLCTEIKLQEFRAEIEVWGVEVGSLMNRKDEKIDTLMNCLRECQELQQRHFSKSVDQIDYLRDCFHTFRGAATAVYESHASDMVEDFYWNFMNSTEIHDRINSNTENIMHSTNVASKDRLKQNYERYMSRKFGKVCAEVEQRYIMRDETAKKMRDLQDKLLLWMKVLEGDMVDVHKTKKFLNFMERQRNYVVESNRINEIEKQCRKILSESQNEMLTIETETQRKLYGLKLEKSYFLDVRGVISNSIVRDKQLTHDKMLVIATESYEVIKKLKEIAKHGELLLSMGACCRKYMTEKEKVVPWEDVIDPNSAGFPSDFEYGMQLDIAKYVGVSEMELAEQFHMMRNFWQRQSNVRMHIILLTQEKNKLIEENEKYRNIIRSMKKSDDVEYILESLQVKKIM